MSARDNSPTPEKRLLVCCARTAISPGIAEEIRRIAAAPLDWDDLLSAAGENSILPLFARQLLAVAQDIVPPEAVDRIKGATFVATARSLFLTAELVNVLERFQAGGIQVIPYKGPVVAAQAYGEVALREYEDLDLILRQRDVPQAHERLLGAGYRPKFACANADAANARSSAIPGEYVYIGSSNGVVLELHTERTLRHFPVVPNLDEFASRLVSLSFSRHAVRTFCAEDALLMLCIHGAKDSWERVSWVADIAEMVRSHPAIDWEVAAQRAESVEAGRMLAIGFLLAADLLDAPFPTAVLSQARKDHAAAEMAGRYKARLLGRVPDRRSAYRRFHDRRRLVSGSLRGWKYALRLTLAPSEEDWATLHLPRALAPLYVALRPLRLVKKYGRSA